MLADSGARDALAGPAHNVETALIVQPYPVAAAVAAVARAQRVGVATRGFEGGVF